MTRRTSRTVNVSALMATLLLGAASGQMAMSQPPPPDGGGGHGGGFGGPGRGGRPPMGGMRRASVVQVPVSALKSGLTLTDSKVTQIKAIQDALKAKRDSLMPPPGSGDETNRPDPETMQANMEQLRKAEQKAEKDIRALLTDTQKTALPAFLKLMDDLQFVGIPAEVYADLNLTSAQKTQLAAIAKAARPTPPADGGGAPPPDGGPGGPPPDGGFGGPGGRGGRGGGPGGDPAARKQAHDKAMALLTDDQKQIVTTWIEAHPRPQRGGPRPGQDGPPPPRDGNGPPPPGDGEAPPPPGE